MVKIKSVILSSTLLIIGFSFFPKAVSAGDVTYPQESNIILDTQGATFAVEANSAADSVSVGLNTITVTVTNPDSFVLRSDNRYTLANDGGLSINCGVSWSKVTVAPASGSTTVVFTPTTNVCLSSPTMGTPSVLSTTSIRWNFTDNATEETGFKVYDGSDTLKATCATADLSYCDETGLSANTSYTRKVVAYDGSGNSSYSSTQTVYTLANAPGTPTTSVVSGTTENVTVVVNSNPSGTEFAIQETGSGNYVNKTTGALQASASWGTYAEFGSGSGVTVTGLSTGTNYTYQVKGRNGDNTETAFGGTSTTRTKSVAVSLSGSISSAVLASDGTTDLTSVANAQTGTKTVRLKKTGGVQVVEFDHDFDLGNLNLSGVSMDSDSSTERAYVTGIVASHTLYIPKGNNDSEVRICPNATSLAEVLAGCSGEINGTNGYNSGGVTVSISGSYWKVTGLTGTGAGSAPAAPTIGTPSALSTATIRWNFTDNDSNETGFKVFDASSVWLVTCASADLTYCDETGLSVNTSYTRKVAAYNALLGTYSSTATLYTLANVPGAPTVSSLSTSTLLVTVVVNSNPSTTEFAIQETGSGNYVQADGSLGGLAVWQTYTIWGGASGVTVTGLTQDTSYTFKVKARNGNNTETAFGSTASASTSMATPTTPTIGTPLVLSTISIRWTFTDNSSNETGFKVYDNAGTPNLVATCANADLTYCDESSLSANTSYTRKVVAYNGSGNSSYTSTATVYTLANAPGTPTLSTPTSTTMPVVINQNSNPAGTEYAIQETGSGNYVNKTTGALQVSASWGTYAEFGSGSGVTVTGLTVGTQYTFKVKARNGNNTETAFSTTESRFTAAVAVGLSVANTSVVLVSNESTVVTNVANAQSGNSQVRIKQGSLKVVDFNYDFSAGNLSLSNVTVESSPTTKKAVIAGLTPVHTLYVPGINSANGVYICPNATTIAEVQSNCADVIVAPNGYSANGITVTWISADSMWQITGLTGTGAGENGASVPGFIQTYLRYDRMTVNTATNVLSVFTPRTTGMETKIRIVFADGTVVGASPTVSTANLPVGVTALPGTLTVGVSGQILTISGVSDLTINTPYGFNITSGITTNTGAGQHTDVIRSIDSDGDAIDGTNIASYFVSSDQLTYTASVPPAFNFILSGNSDTFITDLSPNSVVSTNGKTVTLSTNASKGWIIWVKSTNAALSSVITGEAIPATGTVNGSPSTLSSGTSGYVLDSILSNDSSTGDGTVTIDPEYNGNGTTSGGTLDTKYQPIASSDGTTDGDIITLKAHAAITSVQAAADDYTDTWTIVGVGNF